MKYDVIIGCEIHVQLLTKSKAFCSCPNVFGGEPNSRVCPVCMGLPGSLPVTNGAMIDAAVLTGLALGCEIERITSIPTCQKGIRYPSLTCLSATAAISIYRLPTVRPGGFASCGFIWRRMRARTFIPMTGGR